MGSDAHEHFNISRGIRSDQQHLPHVWRLRIGGDIGPASEPPISGDTITTNSNYICTHVACHTSMPEAPIIQGLARSSTNFHNVQGQYDFPWILALLAPGLALGRVRCEVCHDEKMQVPSRRWRQHSMQPWNVQIQTRVCSLGTLWQEERTHY